MHSSTIPLLGAFASLLLVDAFVSPSGTGWIYLGTTTRVLYGMSMQDYLPRPLRAINDRFGIPRVALIASTVIGCLFFAPLPSWYLLVGFITGATVLTMITGGIGVEVLHRTAPELERPFHLPAIRILAPLGTLAATMIVRGLGLRSRPRGAGARSGEATAPGGARCAGPGEAAVAGSRSASSHFSGKGLLFIPMDHPSASVLGLESMHASPMHDAVLERIERAIHLGLYAPGDRLPPERELAAHLGMSRATIREALQMLASKGYVQPRRGMKGGWFVESPRESRRYMREKIRESLDALDDILDYRLAIEGMAARLGAQRRTDDDLEEMRAAVVTMRDSTDLPGFRRADSRFHLAIAQAARNVMLRDAIEAARATMFLPTDALGFEILLDSSLRGHERILAAIERGETRTAEDESDAHIEITRQELRRILEEEGVDAI